MIMANVAATGEIKTEKDTKIDSDMTDLYLAIFLITISVPNYLISDFENGSLFYLSNI